MTVLAVDGGNTKTLAAIASADGRVLAAARGGQTDIYGVGSVDAAMTELFRLVDEALHRAGCSRGDLRVAVCSLAGADWPEDFEVLTARISAELPDVDVIVVNDAIGALRAGAPDWVGIAVVAGTFNAVGARNAEGCTFHLGFWPDRTGAYDLSNESMKAVVRAGLGLGPQTELTAAAADLYGIDDSIELLHRFTRRDSPGRGDLMRLVPVLFDVAESGDPTALALVADAGRVLGDEARVSAERVGLPLLAAPVVMTGGVFQHSSKLLEAAIMDRLDGAVAVRNGIAPIVGVVQLALDRVGGRAEASQIQAMLNDVLEEERWLPSS
jgi:N-acetylglucosamine kinase-like BadF-type ATPase